MKKTILFAAMATVLCMASCRKENPEFHCGDDMARLQVSVSGALTRATSAGSEDSVNSLQIYVFNSTGAVLEAYGKASGSSVTVKVSTGSKMIAALVNAPELTNVTSLAQLSASGSLLSDNSLTSFVMFGVTESPVSVSGSSSVVVDVKRLASRVIIGKITNGMVTPPYNTATFTVDAIYLVNAGGSSNLAASMTSQTSWYNWRSRSAATGLDDFLYENLESVSIASAASHQTSHYFYCYPNPSSEDSSAEDDSPRYTRLVVQASINGTTWYYPVSLPGVTANHSYEIPELKITRPGSDSPDEPIDLGDAQFSIRVLDWTVEDCGNVII